MSVDFKINLSKELTSSPEQRQRFHRGMMFYMFVFAVLLVASAYFSSVNLSRYFENRQEHRKVMMTTLAVSGLDEAAFKNPDKAYAELENYSADLASLRLSLSERKQLFPILHHLFKEMPANVQLQNLATSSGKLVFGINMPSATEGAGDPVRELKASWENNDELMRRVVSIRPIKGQRRMSNGISLFNVQFECVLK